MLNCCLYRVHKGKLYANTAFPGLTIQVSTDGGRTWENYKRGAAYQSNIVLSTRWLNCFFSDGFFATHFDTVNFSPCCRDISWVIFSTCTCSVEVCDVRYTFVKYRVTSLVGKFLVIWKEQGLWKKLRKWLGICMSSGENYGNIGEQFVLGKILYFYRTLTVVYNTQVPNTSHPVFSRIRLSYPIMLIKPNVLPIGGDCDTESPMTPRSLLSVPLGVIVHI